MLQRLNGLLILLLLSTLAGSALAAPAGFVDEIVPGLNEIVQPTAFAFLPNGDMLVATKPGQLLIYRNGALLAEPAVTISERICTESERGLLGVAVDPQFNTNRFIYLYYTFKRDPACSTRVRATDPFNRISRFVLGGNDKASDETILIDAIPSPNGNHNGGDVQFGKDGYLYISVGDGGWDYDGGGSAGSNDAARDRFTMLGKVLRITRDGGIPAENPFQGGDSARCYDPAAGGNRAGFNADKRICQETFAWGLRNPFRIAFDPNAATTRFFINDVGQGRSEEIDEAESGVDYGWNCREGTLGNNTGGPCSPTPTNMRPPIFEYRRNPAASGQPDFFNGCASITGGAFVPNGAWSTTYNGAYLFADFVCGKIFMITPNGNSYRASLFLGELGGSSATHLGFGPDGALYYADFSDGDIRRLRYTADANRPPNAAIDATPRTGNAPLLVTFSAEASSDPDPGNTIAAYQWEFGDGQTATTATPQTSHSYAANGTYLARLRVQDNRGASSTNLAELRIDVGNLPPELTIIAPTPGERFRVGQEFTLVARATDPEEGPLADASLSWEVRQHHDAHFHPYLSSTGNNIVLTAPPPEDLAAVSSSYLELRVSATDATGSTTTITQELRPQIVALLLLSNPGGLSLGVNGGSVNNMVTTPASVASWPGFSLELSAPPEQLLGSQSLLFCQWSQGGPATQSFVTPAAASTVIAVYRTPDSLCPAAVQRAFMLYAPMAAP